MDEVLGQRHSTNPPVLIASIPEDTPGPSAPRAVVGQENENEDEDEDEEGEEEEEERRRSRKRKGDKDDVFLQLIKEDMRLQREAEERRAQEGKERMERLFSILERLVDK